MRTSRTLSLFLALLFALCPLFALPALAGPAYPGPITITEPATGKRITGRQYGDEFFSFFTDKSGYVLLERDGYLWYIKEVNGRYIADGRVSEDRVRGVGDARVKVDAAGLRDKLTALWEARPADLYDGIAPGTPEPIPANYDANSTTTSDGAVDAARGQMVRETTRPAIPEKQDSCPLLVLHLSYNDVPAAFDDAAWHKRIFDDGVADYYTTISNGTFTYTPAAESCGVVNDGVVDVTLPIDAPLWARGVDGNLSTNNGIMPGIQRGTDGNNYAIFNESSLFMYAMLAAQPYLGDLSVYDRNGDGYITPTEMAFVLVISGFESSGGASVGSPAVWAHSWTTNDWLYTPDKQGYTGSATSVAMGGVKVYKYTLMGEVFDGELDRSVTPNVWTDPAQMQFGTVCHELGHDLGVMDLYDTSYSGLMRDVGAFSVMAAGSWGFARNTAPGSSPTSMDPYDKLWLGFYNEELADHSGLYTLNTTEPSADYNILRVNTDDPDIFYLLENRRSVGYDRGLYYKIPAIEQKQGGVMIWRVDAGVLRNYWESNKLNAREGDYGIMPVLNGDTNNDAFWGGLYFDMGSKYTLPETGTELSFFTSAGSAMQVEIRYRDPNAASSLGAGDTADIAPLHAIKQAPARDARGNLTLRVDADCKKLVSVLVDGKVLEKQHYDLLCEEGVLLTLHKDYIEALSLGEHSLRLQFTDGHTDTTFSTAAPMAMSAVPDVPATGSFARALLPFMAAALLLLLRRRLAR